MQHDLFERLFEAWALRMVEEELNKQKNAMIVATYSNPNYDGEKGEKARKQRIEALEDHHREVMEKIRHPEQQVSAEQLRENAFLAPAMRKRDAIAEQLNMVKHPDMDEIDTSELDQT